jgi:hypothetical protein
MCPRTAIYVCSHHYIHRYRAAWKRAPTSDVCWCMLTYADIRWRMLTYIYRYRAAGKQALTSGTMRPLNWGGARSFYLLYWYKSAHTDPSSKAGALSRKTGLRASNVLAAGLPLSLHASLYWYKSTKYWHCGRRESVCVACVCVCVCVLCVCAALACAFVAVACVTGSKAACSCIPTAMLRCNNAFFFSLLHGASARRALALLACVPETRLSLHLDVAAQLAMSIYTHTYIHVYIYTYIYTYIFRYIYMYT